MVLGPVLRLAQRSSRVQRHSQCAQDWQTRQLGEPENEQEWAKAMEREDFATQFTAAMDCRGVYLAQALAKTLDLGKYSHLLDIAGGSGIYACSLIAYHPRLRA